MATDGEIGAHGYPQWEKDADGTLEVIINWADWLAKRGIANLSTSVWVLPTGLTTDEQTSTTTTGRALFSIGGVRGRRYQAVNRITAPGGHKQDQTIEIYIRPK